MLLRLLKWLSLGGLALMLLAAGPCLLALVGEPVSSHQVDQTARTRYPIVLVHGVMGFAYIGKQSYWRGIPETLRSHGGQVYVAQVSPFNSTEVRGEQLLAQVARIRQESGAAKVNLIGHSHGVPTVRYVAGIKPEWVASVTSVAGPTTGSEVADWLAEQMAQESVAARLILMASGGGAQVINFASGAALPHDGAATVASLTASGMAAFNRRFPAGVPSQYCGQGAPVVGGIHYYSWGSVGQFYRASNPADFYMSLTSLTFRRERGRENDGLVGRCASHLGLVIRDDYPMNHLQSVNQFLGLVGPGVDPVALYVDHAARLERAGL
jgi:triacylglycerol lipase